jgi:uncharacterized repeat protein (TIGR03803 family)
MVLDPQGNLFGTTSGGGANNLGTVFQIAAGSSTIITLASFNGPEGGSRLPYGGLARDAQGNLFGTTIGGISGPGTVFELVAGSNTITTLAPFNGTNGSYPQGRVILDAQGNLFGTTANGGAFNRGTVWELAAGSNTITTLASFNGTNGAGPEAGVILDAQGNLFGTTQFGGANNLGTVFQIAAGSNTITTRASFNGTNGALPFGELVLDAQGNLFGTTSGGGAFGRGTVFELTAVPEPASLVLLGLGLSCLAGLSWRARARRDGGRSD